MQLEPIPPKAQDAGTGAPAYIAPFAVFVLLLAVRRWIPLQPEVWAPGRLVLVAGVLVVFSRRLIFRPPVFPIGSILLGAAVLVIWIGPDLIWRGYRDSWLFHNSITGEAVSSLPTRVKTHALFICVRVAESTILVPILEELFWRGWLMRWLIHTDFRSVPLGQYTHFSFWMVAALFASEHGPYWEVGFAAGIAYNWWLVRTRSLADCILAHAVTNALLAAYVLLNDQWQYWL
jgi:CAAX prenyl protease-like protein